MAPEERAMRERVARRLLVRRTWLELSQQEVGDKAGLSRNFVSAIERGAQGLDAWRLLQIADAIGVTLDWLLCGPDDELTQAVPGRREFR
jgi:transcriptional regulator with XRE-family HTH domain